MRISRALIKRRCLAAVLFVLLRSESECRGASGTDVSGPVLEFHAAAGDPATIEVRDMAAASAKEIQSFFGAPFPDPIHFQMVADRPAFDGAAAKFGVSPTACWMVGLGTADLMVLLSPTAWAKQSCEHDPKDLTAVRQLVAHELVHVYHGQRSPTRDFTGVDDLDWFIEGLAVFASGQLTKERLDAIHAATLAGKLPATVSKVWTGPG